MSNRYYKGFDQDRHRSHKRKASEMESNVDEQWAADWDVEFLDPLCERAVATVPVFGWYEGYYTEQVQNTLRQQILNVRPDLGVLLGGEAFPIKDNDPTTIDNNDQQDDHAYPYA